MKQENLKSIKIAPLISNDTNWVDSLKHIWIQADNNWLGDYFIDTLKDKQLHDEETRYLPQPLNPEYTSEVLAKQEFKVREIATLFPTRATIDYFIDSLSWMIEANKDYNFDIQQIVGSMEVIKIPHTDSIMEWDWDLSNYNSKLTMVVALNDPSEYEGGEFEVWMGKDNIQLASKEKNSISIFPSFCMTRVTPITKGTKHYLIVRAGSKNFI